MSESQLYDSALKSLLGDEVAEILPNLLPGLQYVSEQNIEIDRTTLKADLVYNIKYRGLPHILNMELQTDADEDMPIRMLKYHVGLFDKHRKPVISMVMYPFETRVPETPFKEMSGEELLLQLNYKVLLLWNLEAQQFVQDRVVGMYALLPAMRGTNASLLLEEHMQTYDSLLDSDPYIQQKVALERTLERNEAVQAFQNSIMEITKGRFPALTEIAQKRIVNINTIESLQQLVVQLSLAPDQAAARRLLQNTAVD